MLAALLLCTQHGDAVVVTAPVLSSGASAAVEPLEPIDAIIIILNASSTSSDWAATPGAASTDLAVVEMGEAGTTTNGTTSPKPTPLPMFDFFAGAANNFNQPRRALPVMGAQAPVSQPASAAKSSSSRYGSW